MLKISVNKEIEFTAKEHAKYEKLNIIQKGNSVFLSPVILIPKWEKLNSGINMRLIADFQHLCHIKNVKFAYPELKYILYRIERTKRKVFSVNLSISSTLCCYTCQTVLSLIQRVESIHPYVLVQVKVIINLVMGLKISCFHVHYE